MRLIDADKLMSDIEHYHLSDGKFQHWVEIQPTIEPEPHWIPCHERLPEEMTLVLASDKDGDVYTAKFIEEIDGHAEWAFDTGIIAWMPLPEPYQEVK